MKHLKYIYIALMIGCSSTAYSQNLEESLTVEGKYMPEVIAAERLSVSPAVISFTAPESNISYDLTGITANFAPDALSMPATGWRDSRVFDTSRGYLNFQLGSWLNSSLSAGYAAVRDEDTRLNIRLQHNSTSLWQAWKADAASGIGFDADKCFRYDETIGADFSHRIAGAGTIAADVQYHLGYFNYYGTDWENSKDKHITAPTQTVNDIYARAKWAGEVSGPLAYHVDADVRHFGYRAAYMPMSFSSSEPSFWKLKGERETTVNVGVGGAYSFSKESKFDLGIQYSGVLNKIGNDVNRFKLTPAYEYSSGNTSLHVGMELAVVSAEKTKFRVAPDVRFTAKKGITAFSASIGGGTRLRTLAWMHSMDYYADPLSGCHDAAYSPLDAKMALQFNPGGKWTFGVEGMWRTTLNESFGGLYQAYLNLDGYALSGNQQTRIHGFSIGVNAGYDFSKYFALNGSCNWQHQNGNAGYLNGFDRPEFTANISAVSRPIDPLFIRLSYGLRAKRYLVEGNISRLNLSADYKITEKISVIAEFNNLLDRHEMLLPDLPTEGFTATGGLQIIF